MPIYNLSSLQIDKATADAIMASTQHVFDLLRPFGKNLTRDERQKYGSIAENNKLIVGKVSDYHQNQPALQSPDVDWIAFDASLFTRTLLANLESLCDSIKETSSDFRILYDYDLYKMTLSDYDYAKYKAESTTSGGGFTTKVEELKQFFPNPAGTNTPTNPTPPTP